jgi:hypothetical protein
VSARHAAGRDRPAAAAAAAGLAETHGASS